jgi:hypothetical protein
MKPSTLLLVTFVIWLTSKKRLGAYWKLATTYSGALSSANGGSGSSGGTMQPASLPDFSNGVAAPDLNSTLYDILK